MRFFARAALAWAVTASLVVGDALNDIENTGRKQIDDYIATKSKSCTKDKLMVRKEWGDLTKPERKAWLDGFQCLLTSKPKHDATQFPGAKSRFDDFVITHMNHTPTIHGTGNFLSWHRYFVWALENVMRTECGYTGTQPYWDYGRWAEDPLASPIFDGSDTSLGGNGEPETASTGGAGVGAPGMPGMPGMGGGGFGFGAPKPAGTGGGCVKTGPFKNMTVFLGPMSAVAVPPPPRNPMANGYGVNPRCLRRDITNYLSSRFGKTKDIVSSITSFDKVLPFQNFMQGGQGVHQVGHFTVSGDPGGDFYISPNEPSFWLHHAMIDRIWTIWQSQDYPNRMMQMEGGTTMFGAGRAQSLDDLTDLGTVADVVYPIRDLMSSVDGPFCYVYE